MGRVDTQTQGHTLQGGAEKQCDELATAHVCSQSVPETATMVCKPCTSTIRISRGTKDAGMHQRCADHKLNYRYDRSDTPPSSWTLLQKQRNSQSQLGLVTPVL